MQTRMFAPSAALAGVVEAFWSIESLGEAPRAERVLPTGTTELIVDLRDARRGARIAGPSTRPFVLQRAARESIVGVHFRPGGAAALLGVPADALRDALVPLEDLWGASARELRERLLEATDARTRARVLERALLARRPCRALQLESVAAAAAELERTSPRAIAALAADAELSSRHFIAHFAAQVGLTPKRFARVRRFQAVLARADDAAREGWARVAFDCGYYDQAHLHRDFRDFAALAPGEYLRMRTHDPNHVAAA